MSAKSKMELEMNYPKRGCISDDGKFYTHTDGRVFTRNENACGGRSCSTCSRELRKVCMDIIEGSYVTSDEEREACDMARAAIEQCNVGFGTKGCLHGATCFFFVTSSCHLRMYLASKHQPDAWEVKP